MSCASCCFKNEQGVCVKLNRIIPTLVLMAQMTLKGCPRYPNYIDDMSILGTDKKQQDFEKKVKFARRKIIRTKKL